MLTGDTIFTSRNRDGTAILRGHPGTRRSIRLDIIAKVVPSFLSYFKVLSNGPPRESNPRPPALQSSALPTELINPAVACEQRACSQANPAAVNTDDVHLGLGGVSDRDKANF